jgi:PAS domain S-box-containing protein
MVAVVFVAILIVESVILIMSYLKREGALLNELKGDGTHWVLGAHHDYKLSNDVHKYAEALLRGPRVKGVVILSEKGEVLSRKGEPVIAHDTLSHGEHLHHKDEARLETAWTSPSPKENKHTVVLRMDSSHVPEDLRAFVFRVIGLVLIISAVITLATVIAVERIILAPMFQMRDVLASGAAKQWSEGDVKALSLDDEIGDVARATAGLIDSLNTAQVELEVRVENRTEQLKIEEQRFRDFAGSSSDFFWELDKDLKFSFISDRFLEISGVKQSDVLGKTIEEITRPEFQTEKFHAHMKVIHAHRPFRNHVQSRRLINGGLTHLSINGSPVSDRDGEFLGYRGTGTDVTIITNAMATLSEQKRTLEFTLESLEQGVAMYDAEYKIVAWNNRFTELRNIPADFLETRPTMKEIVFHLAEEGMFPEFPGTPEEKWEQWKTRQKFGEEEVFAQETLADGTIQEVQTKQLPGGGILRTFTDITERMRDSARLAEKDFHLNSALTNMSEGMFVLDEDLNYVIYNDQYTNLIELPEGTLEVGMPALDVTRIVAKSGHYGPGDPEELAQQRVKIFGDSSYHETEILAPSGKVINIRKSPVSAGGCVVTLTDITERKRAEERLIASQQEVEKQSILLQTTLDSIRQGFAVWDHEMRLVAWSAKCREYWYAPSEILDVGLPMIDLLNHIAKSGGFGEGDPNDLASQKLDAIKSAGRNSGETFTMLDGTIVELRRHAMPDGGHAATYTDITERERVVEALRESESRFRAIMDNSPSYIYLKGTDGRYLLVNKHTEEGLGIPSHEIIGKTHEDFYPPELTEMYADQDREVIETGRSVEREIDVPTADGKIITTLINKFPIFDNLGEVEAIGAIIMDITDKIRAEREIADKERQLRETLDHMDSGILMMDSDLTVKIFNDRLVNMFKLPEGLIKTGATLDKTILFRAERGDFGSGKPSDMVTPRIESIRKIKSVLTEEQTFDGRTIQSNWSRGKDNSLIILSSDITQRKLAEEMLHEAKERAESVAEAKSEFVAVVSHEVRTPMNGVLGMARLLQDSTLDDEQREFVDTIVSSGDALVRILNDILDISKLEAGKFDLENIAFSPRENAEQAVALMRSKAKEAGLDLVCAIDPKMPAAVIGDPYRLQQVFLNLLSNAIKFTSVGSVTARVELLIAGRDITGLQFSVEDTGRGMNEDVQKQIFTPYAQGTVEVARKYGGTGLGLAISRCLVEMMGGEIKLESEPGKGSRFWFDVGLGAADKDAITTPQKNIRGHTPTETIPAKVLQVEDNETNRKVVETILSRAGHSVISIEDGLTAAETVQDGDFDIIVMDRHMPGLSGAEATIEIRELAAPKNEIPIIGLTAGATEKEITTCLESGMNTVLTKPVDASQLLNEIADLTSESLAERALETIFSPLLVIDDMEINRSVTSRQIEKLALECVVASSGREGLLLSEQFEFSVILVDISMPEMDGMEFIQRMRQSDGRTPKTVPIIAMTGFAGDDDRKKFLQSGMDDILTKPVTLDALRATLIRCISDNPPKRNDGPTVDAETNDDAKDVDAIDINLLSKVLGETDEGLLFEVIGSFIDLFPQHLPMIDDALEGRDIQALSDAAHAGKSAAAYAAATELQTLLDEIESGASTLEWSELEEMCAGVRKEFDRIKSFCETRSNIRNV